VATGAARRALWRDRDFSVFWVAQTLSALGDSFAYIAVPLLVLHATGSVAQMGLLTGAAGAASVVAGVFAGVLVDRVDRRLLLIGCDLARVALYGLVPLAWWLAPQVWVLYVVLPLGEAIGMVFQVGHVTAVRNLVDGERITEANGKLHATYAVAGIAGPLLAGLVSGRFGPTVAIAIDAASFALSALGLSAIRLRSAADAAPPRESPVRELLAGARFLWRHPVLRALTVLLSFFVLIELGLTDVFIYRLKHDLGQPDGVVGTVLAVAAVGTVAGSVVAAPLRRRLGFGACWIGAEALCGVAIAGASLTGSVPVLAACAALLLGCVSVAGICSLSLRQQVTPDHLLGRVTSAFWTIHSSLGPVGAALLAWAAGRYGVPVVGLLAGTACLLIAGAALLTPVRQANPEALSP
jgi:MFS family permease